MSGYPLSVSIPKPLSIPLRIRYTTYLIEVLPSGVHAKCKQTIQSYTNSRPWHRREIHFNQISVLQWCRLPIRIFKSLSKNVLHILIKITWHTLFFFTLTSLLPLFSQFLSLPQSFTFLSPPRCCTLSHLFMVFCRRFILLLSFSLNLPPRPLWSHTQCAFLF